LRGFITLGWGIFSQVVGDIFKKTPNGGDFKIDQSHGIESVKKSPN